MAAESLESDYKITDPSKFLLECYGGLENLDRTDKKHKENFEWVVEHVDNFRDYCGGRRIAVYNKKIVAYQFPGEEQHEFMERAFDILRSKGEFAIPESFITWVPPKGYIGLPSHLLEERN